MIVIITDKTDRSTCEVIDWLIYLDKEFVVLAGETYYQIIETNLIDYVVLNVDGVIIDSRKIDSIWYRRGDLIPNRIHIEEFSNNEISDAFKYFYNNEMFTINEFIHSLLSGVRSINNQNNSSVNKLNVLNMANQIGLSTPSSILTTSKAKLEEFLRKHKRVITKSACDGFIYPSSSWLISSYTEEITKEDVELLPNNFAPSYFQELIDKKFDVRSFYLNDKFYSMAIFSQNNPNTQIDFRHYDRIKPNRKIPFLLPLKIEQQLRALMHSLSLNCSSSDLIYSTDNIIYFLETNPIGQFGMTSKPCNYHLEKIIAQFL